MANRGAGGKFQPKTMANGFGASKMHNAPAGTFKDGHDWSKLTLGGKPIPDHLMGGITYAQTDQGAAEARAAFLANGGVYSDVSVRVTRDRDDKRIDQYGSDLRESDGLTIVSDPLALAMRDNLPVGHRGLFMSEKQCAEKGMLRGVVEYKKVLVKNKDTGAMEEVRCGGMFLASCPEETAVAAERHYDGINRERMDYAQDKVREQADQVMSEGGMRDLAKRRRTIDSLAGLEVEDPNVAGAELAAHEMVAE